MLFGQTDACLKFIERIWKKVCPFIIIIPYIVEISRRFEKSPKPAI
jgi:hypothetical protein